MNERIDTKLLKQDRWALAERLLLGALSRGQPARFGDLVGALETYAVTPNGQDYFPLWWQEGKKLRAQFGAVVTAMKQRGECQVSGAGRDRQVRLTSRPEWAGKPERIAKAEESVKAQVGKILTRRAALLPDLVTQIAGEVHKELQWPAVETSLDTIAGVAEFGLVYRVVRALIADGQCEAEEVDHPDGDGKVVRLRRAKRARADMADRVVGRTRSRGRAPGGGSGEGSAR